GAEDYILKASIKPGDLITLLTDIKDKIEQSAERLLNQKHPSSARTDHEMRKSRLFTLLFDEPIDVEEMEDLIGNESLRDQVQYVLFIKIHHPNLTLQHGIEIALQSLLNQQLQGCSFEVFQYKNNEYMVSALMQS